MVRRVIRIDEAGVRFSLGPHKGACVIVRQPLVVQWIGWLPPKGEKRVPQLLTAGDVRRRGGVAQLFSRKVCVTGCRFDSGREDTSAVRVLSAKEGGRGTCRFPVKEGLGKPWATNFSKRLSAFEK